VRWCCKSCQSPLLPLAPCGLGEIVEIVSHTNATLLSAYYWEYHGTPPIKSWRYCCRTARCYVVFVSMVRVCEPLDVRHM
jgi:hypothetical protein